MKAVALRVAHISDTHLTPYGNYDVKRFQRCVNIVNDLKPLPDVIVHSGDVTDNGVLAEYELAVKLLRKFKPKIILAPGNHDERNYGQSLFQEFFGPLDFEHRTSKAVFLVMNSPEPDRDSGRLGRRRQRYVAEQLKKAPKSAKKIVVFHHHLISVPYSGRETNVLDDAGDVLDLILGNKVNMVLMGHRHVRRVLKIEETVLINAGTVSSIRTRGRFGNSFNIVDVLEDETVEIRECNLANGVQSVLERY